MIIRTEPDSDYAGASNFCRSWFYFRVRPSVSGMYIFLTVGDLNVLSSIVTV